MGNKGQIIWQRDIPIERHVGLTRCIFARVDNTNLLDVCARFGLLAAQNGLHEVGIAKAQMVLETLLAKDMAYDLEIMPAERARGLACNFTETHASADIRFFSNGDWPARAGTSAPFSSTSLTNATFDGGVIAVGGDFVSCIWFEDED
ncbi:MAG: hypothetical protein H7315_11935 [Herminiimonas sp.]|nr:hypothetical protein [Herminiimonas sp.]